MAPPKLTWTSADWASAGAYSAIASFQTCIALAHSARAISAIPSTPTRKRKSGKPSLIVSGERCKKTQKEKQPDCRARYVRPGAEPEQLLAGAVLFDHPHSANVPKSPPRTSRSQRSKSPPLFTAARLRNSTLSISARRVSIGCHSSLQMACLCLSRAGGLSKPAQRQGATP